MLKIVAAAVLSLGLAAPAFAYGPRPVEFDPAAELARQTGSAQFPPSAGGHVREARVGQGGSQAFPQPTRGVAHSGTDMMVGGSSRYPVLTPDIMSHPPTALDQDHVLVHEFEGGSAPRPVTLPGSVFGNAADGVTAEVDG